MILHITTKLSVEKDNLQMTDVTKEFISWYFWLNYFYVICYPLETCYVVWLILSSFDEVSQLLVSHLMFPLLVQLLKVCGGDPL